MLGVCGSLDVTVMYFAIVPGSPPTLRLKTTSPFSPGLRTRGTTLATGCRSPTLNLPVPALRNVKVPVTESTSDVAPKSYTVLSNWIFGGWSGDLAGLFVAGASGCENAGGWFVLSARAASIVAIATRATASSARFMVTLISPFSLTWDVGHIVPNTSQITYVTRPSLAIQSNEHT